MLFNLIFLFLFKNIYMIIIYGSEQIKKNDSTQN